MPRFMQTATMHVMHATDIVRRRRERASRASRPGRRLWRAFIVAILTLLLFAVIIPLGAIAGGAAGLALLMRGLPDTHTLGELPADFRTSATTTQLFARDALNDDGQRRPVLIDIITDPRASGIGWMSLDVLPEHVIAAYLAASDPQFFTAPSPSFATFWTEWLSSGVVRDDHSPILHNLIAEHLRDGTAAQSGDTRRALQDWLLAWRLERTVSRRQMLEWAINTRYYGNLAYGIEAAAKVYFGKSAADLSLGEAAMLAALAQNPAANPFDNPAAARAARDIVLVGMAESGAISPQDEVSAGEEPLATAAPPGNTSTAPEFARLARQELEAILGPERLLAGEWLVEVTLDPAAQAQVNCVMARARGKVGEGGAPACPAIEGIPAMDTAVDDLAIVILDPATGAIEALAGDATRTQHATGTLARPFIYLTALSQGYTAASAILDVPNVHLEDEQPYLLRNPDGRYLGPLRLRQALAADRAVAAAQALSWVGIDLVRETARALGLQPDGLDAAEGLSFADNGFEATLLDVSRAFATIDNHGAMIGTTGGDFPRPAAIRRITDGEGREVYAYEAATKETLAPELAYLLTDMLADSETRCALVECPTTPTLPDKHPVAISRGQSDVGDAWTIGYTPDRLVAMWVKSGEPAQENASEPLWRGLMGQVLDGAEPKAWARPLSLHHVEVCKLSGLLPSPEARCATTREWFISGTEPTAYDTMTREVAINRETGRLATIFTPPHLVERRSFTVFPPEAAQWAAEAGIETPPDEYDTIASVPTRSGAAELKVKPWATFSGQVPVIGSAGGADFAYYRLAFFPGLMPEQMKNLVARNETPVKVAELTVWDTTQVDNGLYTLLLTVVRQDGTFDEVAVPVTVANEDR